MIMFFDTETNGLPKNYKAPMTDVGNWPRVCQLAWKVFTDDGVLVRSRQFIVSPDGWEIPQDVSEIHGFTTEFAKQVGMPIVIGLNEFALDYNDCHTLVAHNINFDYCVLGAELIRAGIRTAPKVGPLGVKKICTMLSAVDVCKIPGNYGHKWPKLIELHEKLFDAGFDGAHDAMVDVDACAKCYFKMISDGVEMKSI